jgi:hypothetical protein
MCNNQVPFDFDDLQRISLYVPLRVATATRLYVTAVGFVPQPPEGLAYRL